LLNDFGIPSKNALIEILHKRLFLSYKTIEMKGLASIKDKIMLIIYLYHYFIKEGSNFNSRKEVDKFIKEMFF
jgi:hypothetical protein